MPRPADTAALSVKLQTSERTRLSPKYLPAASPITHLLKIFEIYHLVELPAIIAMASQGEFLWWVVCVSDWTW